MGLFDPIQRRISGYAWQNAMNQPDYTDDVLGIIDAYQGYRQDKMGRAAREEALGGGLGLSDAIGEVGARGRTPQGPPTTERGKSLAGAFDPMTGTFRTAMPPSFNPAEQHPLDPKAQARMVKQPEQAEAQSRPAPSRRSAIDEYLTEFGDTGAIVEAELGRRQEAQALSRTLEAMRGFDPELRELVAAGALTPEQAHERQVEMQTENELEENEKSAWTALNQLDPDSYPQFIPGVKYSTEYTKMTGDSRIEERQVELEEIRQRGRIEIEGVRSGNRMRERSHSEGLIRGRPSTSAAGAAGLNKRQEGEWRLASTNMAAAGFSRDQIAQNLVRSGVPSQVAYDIANDSVKLAGGETEDRNAVGLTSSDMDTYAEELAGLSPEEAAEILDTMGVYGPRREAILKYSGYDPEATVSDEE